MRMQSAEIITTNKTEFASTEEMLTEARQNNSEAKMELSQEEEEVRSLELELIEAQATRERKEEAERHGKETNEKIAELTG